MIFVKIQRLIFYIIRTCFHSSTSTKTIIVFKSQTSVYFEHVLSVENVLKNTKLLGKSLKNVQSRKTFSKCQLIFFITRDGTEWIFHPLLRRNKDTSERRPKDCDALRQRVGGRVPAVHRHLPVRGLVLESGLGH